MLFPKKTKYKKQFKNKIVGTTYKGSKVIFGDFGIKSLENGRITSRQIESIRKSIVRKMKRLGFLWIRIFPDTPITKKPNENRMGKGKGSVDFWVAKIRKGQLLFEIGGLPANESEKILTTSSIKLPIKTKFIKKGL